MVIAVHAAISWQAISIFAHMADKALPWEAMRRKHDLKPYRHEDIALARFRDERIVP